MVKNNYISMKQTEKSKKRECTNKVFHQKLEIFKVVFRIAQEGVGLIDREIVGATLNWYICPQMPNLCSFPYYESLTDLLLGGNFTGHRDKIRSLMLEYP